MRTGGSRHQVKSSSAVSVRSCPTRIVRGHWRAPGSFVPGRPLWFPLQQDGCQLNELNWAQGRNREVRYQLYQRTSCWLCFSGESLVTHHPSRRDEGGKDQDRGRGVVSDGGIQRGLLRDRSSVAGSDAG